MHTDTTFEQFSFPNDPIMYIAPTWDQMGTLLLQLAQVINSHRNEYDRIVAIAKGGWTWARALTDLLAVERIGTFQMSFYTDVGQRLDEPIIIQPLSIPIAGEGVLLFDEVSDTGGTLKRGTEYLTIHGAISVTSAVLFHKPHRNVVAMEPDYFVATTNVWVIFPHEFRETIVSLTKKWLGLNVPLNEITQRFVQMGLDAGLVDYILRIENFTQ